MSAHRNGFLDGLIRNHGLLVNLSCKNRRTRSGGTVWMIFRYPRLRWKKTYTLMFFVFSSLFFVPVLCHCYPDLDVCIRVSSDYSLAAPVLWPEVDLELALKRSRKWFSQPNKMTLEMKKKVDNPTKSSRSIWMFPFHMLFCAILYPLNSMISLAYLSIKIMETTIYQQLYVHKIKIKSFPPSLCYFFFEITTAIIVLNVILHKRLRNPICRECNSWQNLLIVKND